MRFRLVSALGILIGAGGLAWGFEQAGQVLPARLLVALGLAWWLAVWRRWTWFFPAGLLACAAAAGYGLWMVLPYGWLLAGLAGTLVARDSGEFAERLRAAPRHIKVDTVLMERTRLARYGLLVFTCTLGGSAAMLAQDALSLAWGIYAVASGLPALAAALVWWPRGSGN